MKRFFYAVAALLLIGCKPTADTVVFGTIRTAEEDSPIAEAIAIKDGKYIYLGNKTGAGAFIKDGVTEVIDHTGKGMVMPGCFEGHAHYLMANAIATMGGLSIDHGTDGVEDFMEKLKAAYAQAKAEGKTCIFGFGWNYHTFAAQGMPTREQAFRALTVNGARQMHVENERGSIKPGKWADFILADKDVFGCPVTDIHKAKVVSTWFEGKKVYSLH